jgi:hypothetical protein
MACWRGLVLAAGNSGVCALTRAAGPSWLQVGQPSRLRAHHLL